MRRFVRYFSALLAIGVVFTSVSLVVNALPTQSIGTWASNGPLPGLPSGAATVTLADDRAVVIGGVLPDGTTSRAISVYDSQANALSQVGELAAARSGHAAVLLPDGRILVVGGGVNDTASAEIELFDPATGLSETVASMTKARARHAAALLPDGRVLIVGGVNSEGVPLADAEVFDLAGTSTPITSSMSTARAGLTATTLLDGQVLVAGGNDGMHDLASAEIYSAISQTFFPATTALSVARSGHAAVLLPHNGGVLIAGGSSEDIVQHATDLFLPPIFPDPYSYGMGVFVATGDLVEARVGAAAGGAGVDGYAVAAGGGAASAEVYRFATVRTNKHDYAPGEPALITGTGWLPNSKVTLLFQEDPAVHDDYAIEVETDGDGNFSKSDWAPERHDAGVRFYLTVSDARSRAQTTFTDALQTNTVLISNPNPSVSGQTVTLTATVREGNTAGAGALVSDIGTVNFRSGGNNCTGGNSGTSIATVATVSGVATTTATFSASTTIRACYVDQGPNPKTYNDSNYEIQHTVAAAVGTTTTIQTSGSPSIYGTAVTFTATVSRVGGGSGAPTGTVQFIIDGNPYGLPVALAANGNTGVATLPGVNHLTLAGSPHAVTTTYAPTSVFTTSNGTLAGGQSVTAKNLTLPNAAAQNKEYNGNDVATVTLGALSGIVGTDDVSVAAGYTATFNNANVGTNKPVTLSTLTLTGAAAANYTVTTPTGLTANITALSITGAFTAANKIYDGTNAATVLTRTLSGKLPGDSVYLTGGVATFADKHVGTGKTVTLTGASLTGSAALNYELSSVGTTTANITQRTLTLTALTNTKVFNGDTSAVAVPSISGLQVYDTVTGLTETYDTPNVGTGKTLAVATYTVNDGNSGNNYQVVPVPNNTGVITIATPGVTVVVTPAPPASLQYSDQVTLAAVVTGPTTPTGTVQFFIGGIAVGTLQPLAGGSAQVTVQQLVAGPRAQPIPVTAVYTSNTPNYASSTGSAGLQVTREDARADYSGLTFFNTSSVSSGTVNVILSATIRDITAVIGDPQYDAYSGDIRKARVKFVNRDAANSVFANCGNLTPVLVDPADLKTGTVSCTTTLSIGSADSDEFTVGIVIGDTTEVSWYARDSATDNTLVTVSKPLTGFITGGGYLVNAASAGQYAGTNGVKANFGFNVKNKSAKTLQGHVNVIIRRLEGAVWKTYQIKTNAIDSLAQQVSSPTLGAAQFVSKANLADITDPYNPIALGGNLALQMTISDRGEPGTADSLAFTLWDGSTLLYSSRWDGVKTIEQVLGGGNLQVR